MARRRLDGSQKALSSKNRLRLRTYPFPLKAVLGKKYFNMKNFFVYWLPPFLWMGFIFPTNDTLTADSTSRIIVPVIKWFLPHAGQVTIETLHIIIRKCIHFFEYGFLAYLLFRGVRMRDKGWRLKWILFAGVGTIGYGALDEFFQTLIPSRTGSFSDWMIDSAGTVVTLLIITKISFIKMRKEEAYKL